MCWYMPCAFVWNIMLLQQNLYWIKMTQYTWFVNFFIVLLQPRIFSFSSKSHHFSDFSSTSWKFQQYVSHCHRSWVKAFNYIDYLKFSLIYTFRYYNSIPLENIFPFDISMQSQIKHKLHQITSYRTSHVLVLKTIAIIHCNFVANKIKLGL